MLPKHATQPLIELVVLTSNPAGPPCRIELKTWVVVLPLHPLPLSHIGVWRQPISGGTGSDRCDVAQRQIHLRADGGAVRRAVRGVGDRVADDGLGRLGELGEAEDRARVGIRAGDRLYIVDQHRVPGGAAVEEERASGAGVLDSQATNGREVGRARKRAQPEHEPGRVRGDRRPRLTVLTVDVHGVGPLLTVTPFVPTSWCPA